jgi:hypothetical protein
MTRKPYIRGGGVRPWEEVAAEFNKRSGQRPITVQAVHKIAGTAERKLRKALGSFEAAIESEDA